MRDDLVDDEVRELLARRVGELQLELDPAPVRSVLRRVERRRRRRLATFGILTGSVAAAVLGLVMVAGQDDTEDLRVGPTAPSITEAPAQKGVRVTDADGVDELPAAPLEVRGDEAIVWTGAELVVWGGDVEAANMGLPGPDRSYADGAAYSPATRTWRMLSASPLPATATRPVGVATGDSVVLARGRSAAIWSPASNSWLPLPDAPADVLDLTFTGTAVISHSANASLDLTTRTWRSLPTQPTRLERPTTSWTGRELIVVGGPGTPFTSAAAIAFDPAAGAWRQIPSPPADLHAEALSADWDGARVIVANYDMHAASFDPRTEQWTQLPRVPRPFSEWSPTTRSGRGKTIVFMVDGMSVLTDRARWDNVSYGHVLPGAVVSANPPGDSAKGDGMFFVWSRDGASNKLIAFDIDRLTE